MADTVLAMILWKGGQLWKHYIWPNRSHYKGILLAAAVLEA